MLTQFWLEIASQLHHGDNAGKQLGRTRSVPVILFAPEPFLSENYISSRCLWIWIYMGVSENVVYPIVPNGFADHYPYIKWLFHWEY